MTRFLEDLRIQRWDDHRFYHHSRINQSLHLLSAISFLVSYAMLFVDVASAALIAWLVAMVSRQSGHFFFEPKGYDRVNQVTHEYKEAVKVGYNLNRKVVLLAIWALSPLLLLVDPTLLGWTSAATSPIGVIHNIGLIWFAVGVAGLVFRTLQLFVVRSPRTGIVWLCKILTDPFHDISLYARAPLHLLRGEILDPMHAGHDA